MNYRKFENMLSVRSFSRRGEGKGVRRGDFYLSQL